MEIKLLRYQLADDKETLAKRFRVLFTLRNLICVDSVKAIGEVLLNDDSDLLKHECAYCMGQMKHTASIPYLIKALEDENQHPMVRHEAGEALGAIGAKTENILAILKKYQAHPVRELSETCKLALDRLEYYKKQESDELSPYNTVDPTPSYPKTMALKDLREIYLDDKANLFDRYKALFSLRNINTPESIQTICDGFFVSSEDSALFKHEVAFVLGQILSLDSVEALSRKLADLSENDMVRHECAEALGSIGKNEIIERYLTDKSRIVRESCQVALDMANYSNDDTQLDF